MAVGKLVQFSWWIPLGVGYNGSVDQLTLAELLRNGDYDRLVRRSRLRYRRRRDRLVEVLQPYGLGVEGTAAGLHALITLPPGVDEADLVARARGRGLALEGLRSYVLDAQADPMSALVVGYGAASDQTYGRCLTLLAEVLREELESK